jgi:hypothetical protein
MLVCAGCTRFALMEPAPVPGNIKKPPTYVRLLVCRDVDHQTVTLGRARAEATAAAGLAEEIGFERGQLINAGYSRIRVISQRVHCVAAPRAMASEHYCVATARVCANRARR